MLPLLAFLPHLSQVRHQTYRVRRESQSALRLTGLEAVVGTRANSSIVVAVVRNSAITLCLVALIKILFPLALHGAVRDVPGRLASPLTLLRMTVHKPANGHMCIMRTTLRWVSKARLPDGP